MSKTRYTYDECLARNLIIVDGITRCGKSMLDPIISSLERVELVKTLYLLEHILSGMILGSIDEMYAKALVRVSLNEVVYFNRIGRNANFRPEDNSSIFNYKEPKKYYKRLFIKDGDEVIEKLRREDNYFLLRTHNIMANLELFDKFEIPYRMLQLFRHPIDNIYSWYERGWGERIGNDPRALAITPDFKGARVPWYCVDREEEWLSLNPYERCVRDASFLIKRSVAQYRKLVSKRNILILTFEEFLHNPHGELKRICEFLNTTTSLYTPIFLEKERAPRVINPSDRERKLLELEQNVNKEIFSQLNELSRSYESNLYGLR